MTEGALGPNDLSVLDLDRYLRQGLLRRAVHDRSPVRRVEDRAVAGAGQSAVTVAYRALLVRTGPPSSTSVNSMAES